MNNNSGKMGALQSLEKLPSNDHFNRLGSEDFPLIEMRCGEASATVSLYGGQVLSYQSPRRIVLWHNRAVQFTEGKALRSGIPICWPWFGAAPEQLELTNAPAHGFARTQWWQVESVAENSGMSKIILTLNANDETKKLWPFSFRLRLIIQLDEVSLKLMLLCDNTGDTAFTMSGALHSYFNISDIAKVAVTGLEKHAFFDQLTNTTNTDSMPIQIAAETDRIYQTNASRLGLDDRNANTRIQITSFGHSNWVLWNPWTQKAATMIDIKDDDWRRFVCIESAIANDRSITIEPKKSHTLGVEIHDASL